MKPDQEAPLQVPLKFHDWWEPNGRDSVSGASTGGHPDAYRIWARPEPNGRYYCRSYGVNARKAWGTRVYRDEFNDWVAQGSPNRAKPFVSLVAASLGKQAVFWSGIKTALSRLIQPVEPLPDEEPH